SPLGRGQPELGGGGGGCDTLLQGGAGPRHWRRPDRPIGFLLQASAPTVQRRCRRSAHRRVHRRRSARRGMNCLIIAAGHGSRLRDISPSKPLTPVAGVPLIEHVARAAAAGGATGFTVVTGHEAERVEAFLADLSARIADWDRPNGHSVLAGAAAIHGDYLLAMSDHLFDPQIVRLLRAAPAAALTLAV